MFSRFVIYYIEIPQCIMYFIKQIIIKILMMMMIKKNNNNSNNNKNRDN